MLLINHPLDCPICDQAGECDLQNLGFEHGAAKTRYEFDRRTFHKIDIGDKIQLHMTRCILMLPLCFYCRSDHRSPYSWHPKPRRSFRNINLHHRLPLIMISQET